MTSINSSFRPPQTPSGHPSAQVPSGESEVSIEDVRRTGTTLTVAQWSVAVVVMTGSAYSAGLAFQHFQESFAAGVTTGLGVDFALSAWLLIARRLRDSGVHAAWGLVLEGATALMTLCLNAGTSLLEYKYFLAGLHTFLPIVLFILSMAGGEAQQKLNRRLKEKQASETSERQAAEEEAARQAEQFAEAHRDLTTIRGTRAAERDEHEALRKERDQAHKDRLAEQSRHRQESHDAEVADLGRLQQERDAAATEVATRSAAVATAAATRSQQGLRQACNKVAVLHATLVRLIAAVAAEQEQAKRAAEDRESTAAAAHARADAHEEATAQAADRARGNVVREAELTREAERLRSKARRAREKLDDATVSQPLSQPAVQQVPTASQPPSQRNPTVSQPLSQSATRAERREWARHQIVSGEWERENGRELRGADIDKQFGGARTGAAILREINDAVRQELEDITSGR